MTAYAIIAGIVAGALAKRLVQIVQSSSGTTSQITIGDSGISGTTGVGVSLNRTSGTLTDVYIGDTVDVKNRATPVEYVGTMTRVRISPPSLPNANHAYCYSETIPDDSVMIIPARRTIFSGSAVLTGPSNLFALLYVRVATTPNVAIIGSVSQNVQVTTGVLTGTTGNDNVVTVSATTDSIYIENRRGSSLPFNFALLSGA